MNHMRERIVPTMEDAMIAGQERDQLVQPTRVNFRRVQF
jgi:hypothetical protein